MNKAEAKYHNTSLKMYEALFKLLKEKEFSDITIKELCDLANINRSTFYSHFDNMYELLREGEEYIIQKFVSSFDQSILFMDLPNNTDQEYLLKHFIHPYLIFIKNNMFIFKVFVENLKTFNTDIYYNRLLKYVLTPALTKKGITDKKQINYISKFYLTGMTSIIMEWINNSCSDDIEYISKVILICNSNTFM